MSETSTGGGRPSGRDRYLDLLRTVALGRVVIYHIFGWAWLTVLFPSMGVMFALAGSLMARSLGGRPSFDVVRGRMRRLLPPMWAFALLVVPLMLVMGWRPLGEEGLRGLFRLTSYLFPVGAPPFPGESGDAGGLLEQDWAEQAVGPLWYIRTYLWFVLASPLLLWAFRRAPWATLLAPLALTAVVGTGLVEIPGETGEAVTDFAVYGSCWILGFAHHEGVFKRVPRYLTVSAASFAMAFGIWWASGHLTEEGWNLDEIPLAQATWSLGFCAILLQYAPSWRELPGRAARFDSLITLANNRAVTVYLWHNLLIMACFPLIDLLYDAPVLSSHAELVDRLYPVLPLVLIWPLLALAVLALGWVEDIGARRRPALWPNGRRGSGGRRGPGAPKGQHRSAPVPPGNPPPHAHAGAPERH
ncbi:acyltransferase [Streptomyces sp. NPDC058653]|uniref:acyltransferase family protein n=1 Tax=Streptomyces sp. NPDC058653 TaxID=3346576 RepID=UPI00364813B8